MLCRVAGKWGISRLAVPGWILQQMMLVRGWVATISAQLGEAMENNGGEYRKAVKLQTEPWLAREDEAPSTNGVEYSTHIGASSIVEAVREDCVENQKPGLDLEVKEEAVKQPAAFRPAMMDTSSSVRWNRTTWNITRRIANTSATMLSKRRAPWGRGRVRQTRRRGAHRRSSWNREF